MPKNYFSAVKIWGVLLFVILASIIFLPALAEYHSTKKDLLRLWQDQSRLVAETIVRGSENMLRFDEEIFAERRDRLLSDGLTLRQLDSLDYPDKKRVVNFVRNRAGIKLFFFDPYGNRIWPPEPRSPRRFLKEIQNRIRRLIQSMPADSLVLLIQPSETRIKFPPGVLIRRAKNRGYIFALYRPAMMNKFARFRRLREWFEQISKSPDILYIQLQRGPRIIAQTGKPVFPPLTLRQQTRIDRFRWKIIDFRDEQIFDYIQRAPGDLFVRVGISAVPLKHLQSSLTRRLIFNSLILLIIGFFVLRFFIGRQNLSFLRQKLRQAETYTGSILKNMSEGIISFNEPGKIDLMNQWAAELFAKDAKDKITFEQLPFDDRLKRKILHFSEFTDVPFEYRGRFLLLSGRQITFQPFAENAAPTRLFLIIIRDFTTQKELETIRSRRSKLLAMGELASRVAHEIRNPLNGIAMLAQRLQKEFTPTEQQDEYKKMTGAIRQETRRINEIVQSFLLYAKTPKMSFEPVSLSRFLRDLEPILQAVGPNRVNLTIEHDAVAAIDRDQLKQVMINLVKNAMEASPPDLPVNISLRKNEDSCQILIEDLGTGVSEKHNDRIFDLYFTTKDDGTGLGLSIVEKIIESHGGRVRFESPYQKNGQTVKGTRFIIELPAINNQEEKA